LGLKNRFDKLTKPPKVKSNQSHILYSPGKKDPMDMILLKNQIKSNEPEKIWWIENVKRHNKSERTKHLNKVLDVLLKHGLFEAMNLYIPSKK
jgi:hypothetical protein